MSQFEQQIQEISEAIGRAEQLLHAGRHQEAAETLKHALKLTEQTHTQSIYKADCLEGLGEVYCEMQDYSQASQYDLELVSLLEKNPSSNVRTRIRVLVRLGDEHRKMGYQVKAVEFFSRAVECAEKSLSADDPLYLHALQQYEQLLGETGGDKRKLQEVRDKLAAADGGVGRESLARSVPVMKPLSPAELRRSGGEPERTEEEERRKHETSSSREIAHSALRAKETKYSNALASMPFLVGALLALLIIALLTLQVTHRP